MLPALTALALASFALAQRLEPAVALVSLPATA